MKGLQCEKALWLTKHHPELATPHDPLKLALFEEGHRIGELARQLFPGGRHIDKEGFSIPHKLKITQDALQNGEETLYEATFQAAGTLVMVDILHCGPRGWELYEVKSSTSEKPSFIQDIAIQAHILSLCNISLKTITLVHINSAYQRQGPLRLSKLFTFKNITQEVHAEIPALKEKIDHLKTMIKTPESPNVAIGKHCFSPYDCAFIAHCWGEMPSPNIFDISGLHLKQKIEFLNQGIIGFETIPDKAPLTKKQWRQVQSEIDQTSHIDTKAIQEFLDKLNYPLYFLDFEGFQTGIPPFDDIKPYQQVPFMYSIHFLEKKGSTPKHLDYIAPVGEDPRNGLAKSLCESIPSNACILVYNDGFEKSVLYQLAERFPLYKDQLITLANQIIDLMPLFQSQSIYIPSMKGSFSIKNILPALIPHLNYDHLIIKDGEGASRAFTKRNQTQSPEIQLLIEKNLKEYCKMDTYAMVKLLETLERYVK